MTYHITVEYTNGMKFRYTHSGEVYITDCYLKLTGPQYNDFIVVPVWQFLRIRIESYRDGE